MNNAIYSALSKQTVIANQMDMIANNLANMSTPGHRAQNMLFAQHMSNPGTDTFLQKDNVSMVREQGSFLNTGAGTIRQTGNPLDAALEGKGFFGVITPDGIQYTRAGNFQTNDAGELITSSGQKVAGLGGGPITIPSEITDITIAKDGTITTDDGVAGRLMVVEFDNPQLLKPRGDGLYETDQVKNPATETTVMQGALEGSNVNPIREITRMIDVSRSYQATQNMIEGEHDRQRTMIQRLSRSR